MDDSHQALRPEPEVSPPAAAEPSAEARARRSALLIIFLVVFIDLFGFGIVLPLLPRYGKEFIPPGWGEQTFLTMKLSAIVLGLLLSSFSAMQFIFAPIWGRISDRVGRRPILLLGLASSVVFYAVFGFASMLGTEEHRQLGLMLLFVSRIGAGIAGATLGTAQAAIADSTAAEHRSRGMALIGAAFGIGFFFGPLLGFGALALFPGAPGGPGFLAAALSFIALVLGLLLLPETLQPGSPHGRRHWFHLRGWRTALATPSVGTLIGIFFLSTFAFANFEPTLALLTEPLGFNDRNNFLVFAYVGLVLALAQGLLYRRLALRVGEVTFMIAGALLMVLGLAGIGGVAKLTENPGEYSLTALRVGLFVMLAVAVTGFAFMTPSAQALISRRSDPAKQGEILGVNQSASAMARILGPAVGVPLYLRTPAHTLPYAFGAGLLVVVLVLTLRLRRA
jgi:MFS family permease